MIVQVSPILIIHLRSPLMTKYTAILLSPQQTLNYPCRTFLLPTPRANCLSGSVPFIIRRCPYHHLIAPVFCPQIHRVAFRYNVSSVIPRVCV
jgi:hypothetical protein